CRRGDNCFEVFSCVEYLGSRHEGGLLSRQVGCEVLMKLRGVKVCETICRLLYRGGFAEVTWEAFSDVSLILAGIWHVGRNVDQAGNRWIRPGFSDNGSS